MSGFEAGCLRSDAELAAIEPEWQALWRRCPASTPFQSPAWLGSWGRVFGTGRPVVATLRTRDDGRLAALLPMYLLDEPPARKLLPIGCGTTDYIDAIIEPGVAEEQVARLLRAALQAGLEEGATVCDLIDLPPASLLREASAPAGWRDELFTTERCPVLELRREGEPAPRPPRYLNLARNRGLRAGGWTVETATAETAGRFIRMLAELHATRWSLRGQPGGVLADERVRAFHQLAAPALARNGVLRLKVLFLRGRPAAAAYALLAGSDRLLLYLSGFDPQQAHESPGTLLLGEILDEMRAEGRSELHFLRGDEQYKYVWGAVDRMNAARRLEPT